MLNNNINSRVYIVHIAKVIQTRRRYDCNQICACQDICSKNAYTMQAPNHNKPSIHMRVVADLIKHNSTKISDIRKKPKYNNQRCNPCIKVDRQCHLYSNYQKFYSKQQSSQVKMSKHPLTSLCDKLCNHLSVYQTRVKSFPIPGNTRPKTT